MGTVAGAGRLSDLLPLLDARLIILFVVNCRCRHHIHLRAMESLDPGHGESLVSAAVSMVVGMVGISKNP